ncbi:MAG TPA: flagellar hook-length control protein FliK, partial [Caulobacteraceae bacterium]
MTHGAESAAFAALSAPVNFDRPITLGDAGAEQHDSDPADVSAPSDPTAAGQAPPNAMAFASGIAGPALAGASAQIQTMPQTVLQLADDILRNVKAKASRFDVTLDPEGLGKVNISVKIGSDGALSATLNFDTPQAAEALKAHSGELRTALEQAGFNLGGSDLSFTAGGSGQRSGGDAGRQRSSPTVSATGYNAAEVQVLVTSMSAARAADGID